MSSFAGIAAIGLFGSWLAYRALAHAGSESKRINARSEDAILTSLVTLGANVGMGILIFMIGGALLMVDPARETDTQPSPTSPMSSDPPSQQSR